MMITIAFVGVITGLSVTALAMLYGGYDDRFYPP